MINDGKNKYQLTHSVVSDGHRGFGFVQYFLEEDAASAMDNMDGAEIEGRVLRVNIAKPIKHKLGATKAGQ
jgi:peptidyl-prolyl isomerase E (cyclophilin E)